MALAAAVLDVGIGLAASEVDVVAGTAARAERFCTSGICVAAAEETDGAEGETMADDPATAGLLFVRVVAIGGINFASRFEFVVTSGGWAGTADTVGVAAAADAA